MNPLPEINLEKVYDIALTRTSYLDSNIKTLMERIKVEQNPLDFKNELYLMIQLYYDGLITHKTHKETDSEKETLRSLFRSGLETTSSFYRGEGIDFEQIKEIFMPFEKYILEQSTGYSYMPRLAYYAGRVQKYGFWLEETFKNDNFETAVCVANSAFEPAFLTMNILDIKELVPLRFSRLRREDKKIKIPCLLEDYSIRNIKDKKVIVVEDMVLSGKSLLKVMKYVSKQKPCRMIGTAVIGDTDTDFRKIFHQNPFLCEL